MLRLGTNGESLAVQENSWDVLDLVSCGVLVIAPDGTVRHANRTAAVWLAPLVLEGRSLSDLLSPSAHAGSDGGTDLLKTVLSAPATVQFASGRTLEGAAHCMSADGWVLTLTQAHREQPRAPRLSKDALTGLPDRSALRERLATPLGQGGLSVARPIGLLCIDLDRFKAINDTLGHPMGDTLLCKVADRLVRLVRPGDVVARMGGDEFMILHDSSSPATTAEILAKRIVDLIGRTYAMPRGVTTSPRGLAKALLQVSRGCWAD